MMRDLSCLGTLLGVVGLTGASVTKVAIGSLTVCVLTLVWQLWTMFCRLRCPVCRRVVDADSLALCVRLVHDTCLLWVRVATTV